jgi:hypothetical protein
MAHAKWQLRFPAQEGTINTSSHPPVTGKDNAMPRQLVAALVLFIAAAGHAPAAEDAAVGFTPLFDGKTLNGWKPLPGGKWEVKDGAILGTSARSERRHGLLMSDRDYSDFEVRFQFRVVKGNSGFYFRSEPVKHAVGVHGFQAEVDNSPAVSGLYETGGRAWVVRPDPKVIQEIYKPGEWNRMSVTAAGRSVVVTLNGVKTSELKDDSGRVKGRFAMQLHGGQDMEVMFKAIEIRDLTAEK